MSDWSIVVAEATVNLVTNPSVEVATTGWAAFGAGSIARGNNDPPFGLYNLAVTPTAAVDDGVSFSSVSCTAGATYTISVYVKGAVGIPYKIWASHVGTTNFTATDFTGDGAWHRVETTFTALATAAHAVIINKDNSANEADYYVDALQVEAKAYATTYCDGSIPIPSGFPASGCTWSGIAHASTSVRVATSRAGGRLYDLEDTYNFKPLQVIGAGAPPPENYSTPYALLDGSLYEHSRIAERTFAINGLLTGTSMAAFLASHGALYSAVKPRPFGEDVPVLLRYSGAVRTLEISAYYAGGLEGGMMYALTEQIQLRFLATDPNWREVIV